METVNILLHQNEVGEVKGNPMPLQQILEEDMIFQLQNLQSARV